MIAISQIDDETVISTPRTKFGSEERKLEMPVEGSQYLV